MVEGRWQNRLFPEPLPQPKRNPTDNDVRYIRSSGLDYATLAKTTTLSIYQVARIARRETFKDVPDKVIGVKW